MDFSQTLFRCSSLGYIMTEPRSKKDGLSDTCTTHLIDVYVANKYGRQDDLQNKFIEKGLAVEEDSITLLSRVKKQYYKKNEGSLSDAYLKGTPDLYEGESIDKATRIIDIKSSWDIYTFHRVLSKPINKMYWWQLQGYMALTGAKSATLCYCLVNTPEPLINDEKRRLMWKMGVATDADPLYLEAAEELDKAMRFDDIPMQERIIQFEVERDNDALQALVERIQECRNWLRDFETARLFTAETELV